MDERITRPVVDCCFSIEMEQFLRKVMVHRWHFHYNKPGVAV
jgi:hypothetical protein